MFDLNNKLYNPQKFVYISSNFLLIEIIFLYYLTILLDFLIIFIMQSFLRFKSIVEILRVDLEAEIMAKFNIKIL